MILRHQKHQIGSGTRQICGILFDGVWLWEEYVNSLIEDVFYHPMNKDGKGAQRLFDAKAGYYLYPEAEGSDDLKLCLNRGSTYEANVVPRDDISITKHGLKIPIDATDYAGFVRKMMIHEQEFKAAFLENEDSGE